MKLVCFELALPLPTRQAVRWVGARGKGEGFFYFLCEGKPFYEPLANVRAGLHSLFKALVVRLVFRAALNCECNSEGNQCLVFVNGLLLPCNSIWECLYERTDMIVCLRLLACMYVMDWLYVGNGGIVLYLW